MRGFGSFLFGAVCGGIGVFAALSYHFVQTKDGFEAIPKLSPTFSEAYVDARNFTAADWAQRRNLTAAVLRANKGKILGDAAVDQAAQAIRNLMEGGIPPQAPPQPQP